MRIRRRVRRLRSAEETRDWARLLALCSLPRSNPGNRIQYRRVNGPYTLYMTAGGGNKLPYGNLPRLILAWVSTEAVQTQSRVLILGSSLSEFMRTLGTLEDRSGSPHGDRTRLRNVKWIGSFTPMFQLIYEDRQHKASVSSQVADRTDLWWNPKRPTRTESMGQQDPLWSEAFFNEIISHPVPLDMNTLKALKRCALGLDLYLWITYRTFALRTPQRLTWRRLYCQFGTDPAKASDKFIVLNFRQNGSTAN